MVWTKCQLISEWNFGEFKSPKKLTFFLNDFCPSLIGQKSFKIKVCFLGDLKTPKFPSDINWPLVLVWTRLKRLRIEWKSFILYIYLMHLLTVWQLRALWMKYAALVQVNLFQKHLFLHQLTHNMTKDCLLNFEFSAWKLQAQYMLCTQIVFKLAICLPDERSF